MTDLERILRLKVPGMTLNQVARLLGSEDAARRALQELQRSGRVGSRTFLLRPVALRAPVYSSLSGPLEANAVERALRSRWTEAPRPVRVYFAGKELARPGHVVHDVAGVSSLFLWHLENRPDWTWIGERELPQRGTRVPDAVVVSPAGFRIALDFGGTYRAPKVASIVSFYANQSSYSGVEIW